MNAIKSEMEMAKGHQLAGDSIQEKLIKQREGFVEAIIS